jgi:hypothetical protein
MVGPKLEDMNIANLEQLLELLNHKNVLVFEGAGIKVTLSPSGPPVVGELSPVPWRDDE